ncbi:MAG: trypsin-like serine protease [Halobacteriovoraceae bacterium]|nr:trypsin-like serine protease [Halobacteriovoraceae bacterium]
MKTLFAISTFFLLFSNSYGIVKGQAKPTSWGPLKKLESRMVKIVFFGPGITLSSCTGIQLSRTVILTAAHCLHNERGRPSPTELTYYQKGIETKVSINKRINEIETITHPDYEPLAPKKIRTDVGLIILNKGQLPERGEVELLVGGDGAFDQPHDLKIRRSRVFGASSIEMDTLASLSVKATAYDKEKNELSFKTTRKSSQVCKGDSGGPLLQFHRSSFKLYGVLSKAKGPGDNCSNEFIITFITPDIKGWIDSHL